VSKAADLRLPANKLAQCKARRDLAHSWRKIESWNWGLPYFSTLAALIIFSTIGTVVAVLKSAGGHPEGRSSVPA
jgi:hypothetical protein